LSLSEDAAADVLVSDSLIAVTVARFKADPDFVYAVNKQQQIKKKVNLPEGLPRTLRI
jgi:hypothetical protein